jgi:hypothetical protein
VGYSRREMGLLVAILLAALPAPVTLHGVGGAKPGMTAAQASRAWGTPVVLGAASPGAACQVAQIRKGQVRGYAIFERKRFGAVFFTAGEATDTGIRIGSTLTAVRKAYGPKLKVYPDKYTPRAKTAYVGSTWKVRFDVSPKGRVTTIAFGATPVTYVEACS